MAKIKVAHLRQFLNELQNDKITWSKLVEKLNEVAEDKEVCKNCGNQLDPPAIRSTGLCVACFTSNA
jgi:recombinational DNA repair protein RecR